MKGTYVTLVNMFLYGFGFAGGIPVSSYDLSAGQSNCGDVAGGGDAGSPGGCGSNPPARA